MNKVINITIPAWHFIKDNLSLRYLHTENDKKIRKVYPRQVLKIFQPLELCDVGLHASLKALDAFQYHPTNTICRVDISEEILVSEDKICGSKREVLWIADITKVFSNLRKWINYRLLEELKRVSKKKNPLKLKQLRYIKNIFNRKLVVITIPENEKYFQLMVLIARANGYAWKTRKSFIKMDYSDKDMVYNFVKGNIFIDNFKSEEINSKFEDLIFSAPRIK